MLGKYGKLINRKIRSSIPTRDKTTVYLLTSLCACTHVYKLYHSVTVPFLAFFHI